MNRESSRREWLTQGGAALGAGMVTNPATSTETEQERPMGEPFGYCLNSSTISGQKLPVVEVIDIAARAGYTAVEPWIRELDVHVKNGGSLKDVGKRLRDQGLSVPSAIGFAEWIVDDEAQRMRGLEEMRRCMDIVQQIGGTRIAAPPSGATKQTDPHLRKAAERYRAILELGEKMAVVPQVELWGSSSTLGRLSEVMFVALETGHPRACILPDVYHLYKGGSSFDGLKLLSGAAFHVLHFNDYPAKPARAEITDAFRVYPGDGVAPLADLLRDLRQIGFRGMLSLELFNRDYWQKDALTVARVGLEKMRAAVRSSAKA